MKSVLCFIWIILICEVRATASFCKCYKVYISFNLSPATKEWLKVWNCIICLGLLYIILSYRWKSQFNLSLLFLPTDIPVATAVMTTPALGPPGLACTMSLWYFCHNEPLVTVTAWTADGFQEQIANSQLTCSANQHWRQGRIFIGEYDIHITVREPSLFFSV